MGIPPRKGGGTIVFPILGFDELKIGRWVGRIMPSKEMEEGWKAIEGKISSGNFDEALEELRGLDEKGEYAMTWKLAGDCKKGIAQETGLKKMYRESTKHYRQALNIDPKFKDARIGLEGLQGEMSSEGVRERLIPKMIDDGTPTFFGIIAIPVLLMFTLAVIKVISDGTLTEASMDYNARIHVKWTDDDGLAHREVIEIELYHDAAPIAVQNWIDHAEAGNYDGIRFHRVIDDFMLQTGDVEGMDGSGGYAYEFHNLCNGESSTDSDCNGAGRTAWTIPDELDCTQTNPNDASSPWVGTCHVPGALAMAKTTPPDTGGSQFYIVDQDSTPSHLNGVHAVFGQVTSGMEHVQAMSQVETGSSDKPVREMTITSIEVDSTESKGLLDYLMFWN